MHQLIQFLRVIIPLLVIATSSLVVYLTLGEILVVLLAAGATTSVSVFALLWRKDMVLLAGLAYLAIVAIFSSLAYLFTYSAGIAGLLMSGLGVVGIVTALFEGALAYAQARIAQARIERSSQQ